MRRQSKSSDHFDDVTLPFLIQLLCEFPKGLEPVASEVELVPRTRKDIEGGLRGETPD